MFEREIFKEHENHDLRYHELNGRGWLICTSCGVHLANRSISPSTAEIERACAEIRPIIDKHYGTEWEYAYLYFEADYAEGVLISLEEIEVFDPDGENVYTESGSDGDAIEDITDDFSHEPLAWHGINRVYRDPEKQEFI